MPLRNSDGAGRGRQFCGSKTMGQEVGSKTLPHETHKVRPQLLTCIGPVSRRFVLEFLFLAWNMGKWIVPFGALSMDSALHLGEWY